MYVVDAEYRYIKPDKLFSRGSQFQAKESKVHKEY